jgi:hypothetical protein
MQSRSVQPNLFFLTANLKRSLLLRTVSLGLLVLLVSCSSEETPTPSPVASAPVKSAKAKASPTSTPTPVPSAPSNILEVAADKAEGAVTVSKSAQSPEDWALVAAYWQDAIAVLKTVPDADPRKAQANQKIAEYQSNLTTAQQKAGGDSSATKTPASPTPKPSAAAKPKKP